MYLSAPTAASSECTRVRAAGVGHGAAQVRVAAWLPRRPIFAASQAGGTAPGYRAVRSGVQGRPIGTTHALTWRVPPSLTLYRVYLDRPSGYGRKHCVTLRYNKVWSGSGRRRGSWAHSIRSGGSVSGSLRQGRPWPLRATRNPEFGERSASAPQLFKNACNANEIS
eukprot:6207232-Pleurochrysis_carterae.AAC.3